MKLIEIEISNMRGVRYLKLQPKSRNMVIWGANGSGKSGVIDAIDFLLTGQVSRLMGAGTGGITLAKHGPHIDSKPDQAWVRAKVLLSGLKDEVTLTRRMSRPSNLECDPDAARPQVEIVQSLARRGQHVLTRREILRFVTAEGGSRAQEIQELLNVNEIENIRKNLVKVKNSLEKERKTASSAVATAEGAINATLNIKKFDSQSALNAVNQNRAVLGAEPTTYLTTDALKFGIQLPSAQSGTQTINVTIFTSDIDNVKRALKADNCREVADADSRLRDTLTVIRSRPELQRALSLQQLTELGMQLLGEDDHCPLCDAQWPAGHLQAHFQNRLNAAEEASNLQKAVIQQSQILLKNLAATRSSLDKIIAVVDRTGVSGYGTQLGKWSERISRCQSLLDDPITDYPGEFRDPTIVHQMLADPSDQIEALLDEILSKIQAQYPGSSPEQTAWDTLTRLEENLKALEQARNLLARKRLFALRASALLDCFEQARDSVLGRLYREIGGRFTSLYRNLHGEDEVDFEASLQPNGAALEFEVEFYGRGKHPPHALHSEGHQDSMGLCLFLALAERLTGGLIDLVLLDDVVMSVDSDHRRELCRLLTQEFPDRQFLITTHDRDWAGQLKSEGVVSNATSVQFYNWSLDAGPQVADEPSMWDLIDRDLKGNDVPSAAARLRRGSEQFYSEMCDRLQAQIRYHINGRWELGELLPAAVGKYRTLLKKGKTAAQSWGQSDTVMELNQLDTVIGQINNRIGSEQWAVNANVHYNAWHRFTRKDFEPVVRAFHDMYDQFHCSQCGSVVYLAVSGKDEEAVKCKCGEINWNLVERRK